MLIEITRKARATSWWATITRWVLPTVISLFLFLVLDLVIAIIIPIIFRTWEPYTQWEPLRFQEWKFPIELTLLFPIWIATTCCVFVCALYDISSRQPESGSSEQDTALDERSAETAAAQHAVDDRDINATAADSETPAEQHAVVNADNSDTAADSEKRTVDDEDNHSTAIGSEQRLEDNGDNEEVAPQFRQGPPGYIWLLGSPYENQEGSAWRRQTLSELLAVPSPDRTPAPSPEQDPTPVLSPDQALSAMPTPDQTFSEHSSQLPSTPYPTRRGRIFQGHDTAPQSLPRSVSDDIIWPASPVGQPPSTPSSTRRGSRDYLTAPQSLPRSVSEASITPASPVASVSPRFPGAQVPSRREYKEFLFQEARLWSYAPGDARLKALLHFEDDDDESLLPPRGALEAQYRRYEMYARNSVERDTQPIRVYGTPALYELDRLRLWVNINQHRDGPTWPPGYEPVSTDSDNMDDMSSIFSEDYQN